MAKKMYVCEVCVGSTNEHTFEHKRDLKHHERWNNTHRELERAAQAKRDAERDLKRAQDDALRMFDIAKRPIVDGNFEPLTDRLGNEIKKEMVYHLYSEGQKLQSDVDDLLRVGKRIQTEIEREVIHKISEGGATRLYGTSFSSSYFQDGRVLETRIVSRRETLAELENIVGVRIPSVHHPKSWKRMELIAEFEMTQRDVLIDATDKWIMISNPARSGPEVLGQFDNRGEAAFAILGRVGEWMQAMEETK